MTTAVKGLDLPGLQRFFAAAVPDAGSLRAELISGGRSNLTYRVTDGHMDWVLRRPPLGELTPSAHDMAREYRVVEALYGSGVPVARPVAYCDDPAVIGAPFGVVEHISGRVLRTREDLESLSDSEIERCAGALVDVMATLHAIDPAAVGLSGFGRPDGYLRRQLARWYDQWKRVATRDLDDLDRLHQRLERCRPDESGTTIVHGDIRIDNVIIDAADPSVVLAVVDWEMATLGDPLADLGLHLAYRDSAFEPVQGGNAAACSSRMPGAEWIADRYAHRIGCDLGNLAFYLAMGYFKAAVIAEGIHARHISGHTVGEGFDTVGEAVPGLVAAGIAALRG